MEECADDARTNDAGCDGMDIANNLYERLQPTTTFILPYHQYFCTILTNLLNARISVANDWVLEIYKTEHQLVHHLQNLPKVYFMEAGDLMFDFYSKLFVQVSASVVVMVMQSQLTHCIVVSSH